MEKHEDIYEVSESFEDKNFEKIDTELQKIVLESQSNRLVNHPAVWTNEKGQRLVDVTAVLKDPQKPVQGLNVTINVGQVVTATVSISDILNVKNDDNIISLKSARKITPSLKYSVPDINASQELITPAQDLFGTEINGKDVIVGIIDYGCDFRHKNFIKDDGTTRILYLWDQTGGLTNRSPQPYNYGREFSSADINEALNKPNPYTYLKYTPELRSHGTHVMDIAAGNGKATLNPGVAPNADLIFVEINANDYGTDESFGNSVQLIEAAKYIFDKAASLNKACVINLSLGTYGGPHDGSTHAEKAFDILLQTPGRAIVIAAGNSYTDKCHTGGKIQPQNKKVLNWQIPPQQNFIEEHEMEIWYEHGLNLRVTLETPSGQRITLEPGQTKDLKKSGVVVGHLVHRMNDSMNQDNVIDMIMYDPIARGSWKVELENISNTEVEYHGWIERFDYAQSYFESEADGKYTLGSISCGEKTIVVGSFDATDPSHSLSYFSSAGPTRDNKNKPEVSAPGHEILAANATTQSNIRMSGTSMASPHVTGLVALILQVGGKHISIDQIRDVLMHNAVHELYSGFDLRYGNGRVNALNTILALLKAQPASVQQQFRTNGHNGHTDLKEQFTELIRDFAKVAKDNHAKIKVNIEIE